CAFTPNKQGIADFFESTSVVHMGYLELDEKWANGAKK
ncbi:RDD family protein, partial [Listeria monocytogenes]|nr:RDD family protein [Listeria monocytogenes]